MGLLLSAIKFWIPTSAGSTGMRWKNAPLMGRGGTIVWFPASWARVPFRSCVVNKICRDLIWYILVFECFFLKCEFSCAPFCSFHFFPISLEFFKASSLCLAIPSAASIFVSGVIPGCQDNEHAAWQPKDRSTCGLCFSISSFRPHLSIRGGLIHLDHYTHSQSKVRIRSTVLEGCTYYKTSPSVCSFEFRTVSPFLRLKRKLVPSLSINYHQYLCPSKLEQRRLK